MRLAKPQLDVGGFTSDAETALAFWRGLPFAHEEPSLRVNRAMTQHRFEVLGTVVKINHGPTLRMDGPQTGSRELFLATGPDHVAGVSMLMHVASVDQHREFYERTFGFRMLDGTANTVAGGETRLHLREDPDVAFNPGLVGEGWRYITVQVNDVDTAHEHALGNGAREELAPVTLGHRARISMILDPDGNVIELSQRADLTGRALTRL